MPYLPLFATGIAVANQGKISFEILDSSYTELAVDNLFPSQKEGFVYEDLTLEDKTYPGFFPESEIRDGDAFILRDYRVKPFQISPFLYNEESKTLRVYDKITFKVSTNSNLEGFNEKEETGEISPAFQRLYQATILNYNREIDTEYFPNVLFIYRENSDPIFQLKLQQYVKIKRQKGFNVRSVSTSQVGSTSSSGIKSYIQNLFNGNDFKPDYVVLVGDVSGSFGIPTFNESYADNAEGDYPYTHLIGNDQVGDIFIGRMSVNNSTDLSRYVGKMRSYEGFTNPNDTDYLNNMLLVGDTDPSGESTVNHCKFVKQISTRINPLQEYTEVYGNNPSVSEMNTAINNGIDFFVYRGFIGMSGWNPGSSQTNTHKLNHGVIITCATGNFASSGTTEQYVNLGSETSPQGGITAIGMATSSTHTSFNNSLSGGIFHGIYNLGQRTMGEALLTGKVTTYIVYKESDMDDVKKFTHWCNLIGDPTVDVYTGEPSSFTVEVSDFYPDSQELYLMVKDQNNHAVKSAIVTLNNEAGDIIKTFTNNEGIASLDLIEGETAYTLTVDKINFFPYQEELLSASESDFRISSIIIDDDNNGSSLGNGNNLIEAGERIELNFLIENMQSTEINNIEATLSINYFQIDLTQSTSEITSIAANATSSFNSNFLFDVDASILNDTELAMVLDLTYGAEQSKRLYYTVHVNNGHIEVTDTNVVMLGSNLQAEQTASLSFTVMNSADLAVENAEVSLIIDNGHFTVLSDNITIPLLASQQVEIIDFQVTSDIDLFAGMTTDCILKFNNQINFYQESRVEVTFGDTNSTSPLGPDSFGYVIYDSGDIDYPECPEYAWIEIAPANGGTGTALSIYDPEASGEGDGVGSASTEVVDLPFQFIYYGESYNQITVCSNGFISFGANSNGEFRNYRLPGALGPNGMIAAFWDDMHMEGNSGIYTYYNSEDDYFVIQWEQMVNGSPTSSAEETFQIILYNPQRYASSLNQGTIKIQYKDFNNVDNGNPGSYTPWHGNYASIGIESPCGTMGLEYTYNQNYPAGAHELEDGMALYITTKPVLLVEPNINIFDLIVLDENSNSYFEVGEEINIGIALINTALTPLTHTTASISSSDNRINIINGQTSFADLILDQESYARDYFTFELNDELNDGEIITLNMEINGDNSFTSYKDINLTVSKPNFISDNIIVNDYSETGNNNFVAEQGETISIAWCIKNTSNVDGLLDTVSITSSNPNISLTNTSFQNIKIKAQSSQQVIFTANISATAPQFESIPIQLSAELAGENVLEYEYFLTLNTFETAIDFEENNPPISLTTPWAIGSSNTTLAHGGNNILATNLSSDYPNDIDVTAWTDYFVINPATSFSFFHKYAIESGYDGGQIVARIEGTTSDIILTPNTGYPSSALPALGGPGFDGNMMVWTQVVLPIPNDLIGQNVKFGFRFASDFMVTDAGWFIDDVIIGGAVQESFVLTGNVALLGGEAEVNSVDIEISEYCINPQNDGNYKAILPLGSFNASYSLAGYRSATTTLLDIDSNQLLTRDIALHYLNPAENLTYQIDESELTLSWIYENDPEDEFSNFIIEQKFNTGEWEEYSQTSTTTCSVNLSESGHYSYRILAQYEQDFSFSSNIVSFDFLNGTENEANDIPLVTALKGNYPNPFNPETSIAYTLAKASNVKIKIYNLKGQLVKDLENKFNPAGNYKVTWNGKNNANKAVSSGIYFIRLETDNFSQTHKAILMK